MKAVVISIPLTALAFGACVSTKKYEASLAAEEDAQRKVVLLEDKVKRLENEQVRTMATASEALDQKQIEVNRARYDNAQLENRLTDLESLVQDQRNALQSLHSEVCSALKCFTPSELTIDVREGKLYVSLSDKLLFTSGSASVNERGEEAIAMLAEVLSRSDLEIMIEGHTDSIPIKTAVYLDNWDLSVHRATSVTRIMVENGIPQERIIASGRGDTQPIASNATLEGRQLNRRTEIVLAPKLDKLWKLAEEEPVLEDMSSTQ